MVAKIPLEVAEEIDRLASEQATFRHRVVQALIEPALQKILANIDNDIPCALPEFSPFPRAKTRSLTLPLSDNVRAALDQIARHCLLSRHQTLLRILIPVVAAGNKNDS